MENTMTMSYEQASFCVRDCQRTAEHNAKYYERIGNADSAARERHIAEQYATLSGILEQNEKSSPAEAVALMHEYDRALRNAHQVPLGMTDGYLALMRRLRTIAQYNGALWGDMP